MIQPSLLELPPAPPRFDGTGYDEKLDRDRLAGQIARVYDIMRDGKWRTVTEIHNLSLALYQAFDSETSISAQLRNLRKPRFGAHRVDRQRRTDGGLWEFRLVMEGSTANNPTGYPSLDE